MKSIIRKEYGLSYLKKIWIDLDTLTFKIRMGDCMSMDIDLPNVIKRELKIDQLLNGKNYNQRW